MVAVLAFGVIVNAPALTTIAGLALLGFAAWHAAYGQSKRIRIGMQTGLIGLLLWSFLMANAAAVAAKELTASNSFPIGLAVVGMHTGAMLAGTAVTALVAYRWVGIAFLRRGWINLDFVWTVALAVCGILLLVA